MYRGVISTEVEQVELFPTEICLQHVEQLKNNKAPAPLVTVVEAPEQEGEVPLLQGPSGGGPALLKVPPTGNICWATLEITQMAESVTSEYFLSPPYLKVPPVDIVKGLEEFAGVGDFVLPQLYNQKSVGEKKDECFFVLENQYTKKGCFCFRFNTNNQNCMYHFCYITVFLNVHFT